MRPVPFLQLRFTHILLVVVHDNDRIIRPMLESNPEVSQLLDQRNHPLHHCLEMGEHIAHLQAVVQGMVPLVQELNGSESESEDSDSEYEEADDGPVAGPAGLDQPPAYAP